MFVFVGIIVLMVAAFGGGKSTTQNRALAIAGTTLVGVGWCITVVNVANKVRRMHKYITNFDKETLSAISHHPEKLYF